MSLTLTQLAPYGITAYHPRSSWEPYGARRDTDLSRRPPNQHISQVTRRAWHYTAAINLPDGDPNEILDGIDGIRRLLANAHMDYLRNRKGGGYRSLVTGEWFPGYPLGYSWAYDWLGGVWEIMGFEYLPAATGGHNEYTKADLLLTDRADPASAAMLRSARGMARFCRDRGAPLRDDPWSHGWFYERTGTGTATACCGDANEALINRGLGNMSYSETGAPTVDAPIPFKRPTRAYDSRPGTPTDPTLGANSHNKSLPRTHLMPGAPRKVFVGLASTVDVNVTAIGRNGSGWIEVTGSSTKPLTSLVNWSQVDNLESASAEVQTDGGYVWVHGFNNPCDFFIDVRGQFPAKVE